MRDLILKSAALMYPLLLLGACTNVDRVTAPASLRPADAPARSATVVFKDRITFKDEQSSVHDLCTGAVYPGVANVSVAWFTRRDAAGGYHDSFTFRGHGTFTDPATGAEYIANQVSSEAVAVAAGETRTFIMRGGLIGRGRVPNEHVRWSFHVTRNANGDVTASFDRMVLTGEGCTEVGGAPGPLE